MTDIVIEASVTDYVSAKTELSRCYLSIS